MTDTADPLKHGKYSTYVLEKCRCDECRAANRIYRQGYVARKRAEAEASQ